MLDRVALHQTRLRSPGISLDSKGIALGAKGLLLLPSLDRLVGFLSLYTSSGSLADIMGSLAIEIVRSKLGHREVIMTFAADTSERMDRIAELARLSGGYTFTGTKRHFVQYRDAAAPFGYDVRQITPTDAPISLNHSQFSQEYEPERKVDLASLVRRLEPRLLPSSLSRHEGGPRWICTEAGLGPALIHYFVRSLVPAEVGVAEWPPASGFDETPIRRYLFKLEAIPARMTALLRDTPGIDVFIPTGPGSGVEVGYLHPINLRACPVFPPEGLVLLRGGGRPPIAIERLPALGPVESFAQIRLHEERDAAPSREAAVSAVAVPLRLAPDTRPWRNVTATLVRGPELGLLRQLAYRLGRTALEKTQIAFTEHGAFLTRPGGIEGIPVGELFRQIHSQIFVSAGYAPVPAVSPEVLHGAFGSPRSVLLFLQRDGQRIGVPLAGFVPLEQALLDAQSFCGLTAESVVATLTTSLPELSLDSPGFRPLRDVEPLGPSSDEDEQ